MKTPFLFSLSFLFSFSLSFLFSCTPQPQIEEASFGDHNRYLYVAPPSGEIEGVLLLMTGFGQPPESIFEESEIYKVAAENGLLTVALSGGNQLWADVETIDFIDQAVLAIMEEHGVSSDRFILGGFSAGGTLAMRYTQLCYQNNDAAVIHPQAVFTVDSPIDLFALWDYFDRELERDLSEAGIAEAQFVSDLMREEIGTPDENPELWNALTPFHTALNEPGNERFLSEIPVRVYHDLDVNWLLKERGRSIYDCNALPSSEMIKRLRGMGNEKAEFMQTLGTGYRSNGTRHPHSWSIVDPEELVDWAIGVFTSSGLPR